MAGVNGNDTLVRSFLNFWKVCYETIVSFFAFCRTSQKLVRQVNSSKVNTGKRVEASSLFETIVALTVIMIVFGIAMTIYANIMNSSTSLSELKAAQRLEEIARETMDQKKFVDELLTEEGLKIEKRVSKYKGIEGLWLLELEVINESKRVLAERKEIFAEPNDKN